jgi:hypothetical protein
MLLSAHHALALADLPLAILWEFWALEQVGVFRLGAVFPATVGMPAPEASCDDVSPSKPA